jgi:hypothetical protein
VGEARVAVERGLAALAAETVMPAPQRAALERGLRERLSRLAR